MATYTQSELDLLFPKEKSSGSLMETLSQENNFKIIRNYMDDRFSMTEDDYSKKELIDSFVNNMRKFNFGQSLVTASELSYLNKGEGRHLEKRRKLAGEAYNVFDSLDGAFSKDRTNWEKADAVYDYSRALIVDPVNILSLGVGKLFASGATKLATQIAKKSAIEAAKAATKSLGKKSVTKKGQEEIARQARKAYTKKIVEDASYKKASNRAMRREIVSTAITDAAAGVSIEAMGQKARIKADVQQEYDPLALFLSAAGGLSGGGLAFTLSKTKGMSNLPLYSTLINRSEQIVLTTRKEVMEEAKKAFNAKKVIEDVKVKSIESNSTDLVSYADRYADLIAEGLDLRLANKEITLNEHDEIYDFNLINYFYQGDGKNVKGLKDILYDSFPFKDNLVVSSNPALKGG